MSKLSGLILLFAIAFSLFLLAPAFMDGLFGPFLLMKWGDVFDVLTPLVLLPLYWLLFVNCCDEEPSLIATLAFLVLAGFWAMGHGMHLAANSIAHLLEKGSDVFALTYFYDEVLSHYLWHFGVVLLAVLLLVRGWRHPYSARQEPAWPAVLAGIIHGFTLFLIFIEAGTVILGVTFILICILVILIWGRDRLKHQPIMVFLLTSSITVLLFLAGWGFYWKGFPQFSELGII